MSPRRGPCPPKLPPLEYPGHFEVRYVSFNGGIRWKRDWVNVSIVCAGEYVELEEIDNGIWNVYFGPLKLGRLLKQHTRIEDDNGKFKRRNPNPSQGYERREIPLGPGGNMSVSTKGSQRRSWNRYKSVTHVPGLFCYPCPRPFTPTRS